LDVWADVSAVELRTGDGGGTILRLGPLDATRALASVEPVGVHGELDRAGALARLGRTGLRRVLTTYGS
jgi:NTE family protein